MFALRERRVHVTQDDFDMAVSKVSNSVMSFEGHGIIFLQVMQRDAHKNMSLKRLFK